jgi:dephospho-CoA kinase
VIVLGVVGAIGSGKSLVARLLAEAAGGLHLDADSAAQAALEDPGVRARVQERFGAGVLRPDGGVDRSALSRRVFDDAGALKELEAILHPLVSIRLGADLESARARGCPLAVLDIPLLLERAPDLFPCDRILFVSSSGPARAERLASRGWPADEAARRERHQWPEARKRARATDVVPNDGTIEELRGHLAELWSRLRAGPTPRSPASRPA